MTLGVLGGGQLGRMLALAGYPLGMRFRFLDPEPTCPAGHVGELVVGNYDDERALGQLIRGVDVVTFEFENVPASAARWLTEHVPVFPGEQSLATAQDRALEKRCFEQLGIAVPRWRATESLDDVRAAIADIGLPCVLKTRRFGYDGKGQGVIRAASEARAVWEAVGRGRARCETILEELVHFEREVSVVGVRARDGAAAFYPPVENVHSGGILRRSTAPAPRPPARAAEMVRRILEHLGHVGVLAVEFFQLDDGTLLANEMAPRVHNSGHWTIEGAECSQFENHIRAVAGLPLGSTDPRGHSVMLNIIGDQPDVPALLAVPGAHVHMYGKSPRPGRKLGHVTVCASEAATAARTARQVDSLLRTI